MIDVSTLEGPPRLNHWYRREDTSNNEMITTWLLFDNVESLLPRGDSNHIRIIIIATVHAIKNEPTNPINEVETVSTVVAPHMATFPPHDTPRAPSHSPSSASGGGFLYPGLNDG